MAGITQNGQKSLTFIVVPKLTKQLKLVLLMEGNCSYEDCDNNDNNNNSDNDKDSISDKDNNSNREVT